MNNIDTIFESRDDYGRTTLQTTATNNVIAFRVPNRGRFGWVVNQNRKAYRREDMQLVEGLTRAEAVRLLKKAV